MNTRIRSVLQVVLVLAIANFGAGTTCNSAQAIASGTYIAAEAGTTELLHTGKVTVAQVNQVVADWGKFQAGTITSADEIALLNTLVTATKGQMSAVQAATLDGFAQQLVANQNPTAPTILAGNANTVITTLINGAARAALTYVPGS